MPINFQKNYIHVICQIPLAFSKKLVEVVEPHPKFLENLENLEKWKFRKFSKNIFLRFSADSKNFRKMFRFFLIRNLTFSWHKLSEKYRVYLCHGPPSPPKLPLKTISKLVLGGHSQEELGYVPPSSPARVHAYLSLSAPEFENAPAAR